MTDLNLDFSGGQNSWFDFWHTHVDWKGKGNDNWKSRLAIPETIDTAVERIEKGIEELS